MIYLGTPGRMVGVKCPSSQRVTSAERYVFQQTLEGRVKAQVVPGQPRVWDVGFGDITAPAQVAALMEFVQGAWGDGPFCFVPTEAPVTNLLSPQAARLDPDHVFGSIAGDGGPVLTADGWSARSVLKGSGAISFDPVPVLPGGVVTGSAYVRGDGGRVRLRFFDIAGEQVAVQDSGPATAAMERQSVTRAVPEHAVSVQLNIAGTVDQFTRPAVTWTDEVQEYSDGNGCPQAVVHAVSKDLVHVGVTGTFSSMGFTVTEVGS